MEQEPDESTDRKSFAGCYWRIFFCGAGLAVLLAVFSPAFMPPRLPHHPRYTCKYNLHRCAIALLMYTADYEGRLPQSVWMDATAKYATNDSIYRCPECPVKGGFGYAMHRAMLGQVIDDPRDAATVLIFDSSLTQRNAVGDLDTLPNPPRHGSRNNFAFADLSVQGIGGH